MQRDPNCRLCGGYGTIPVPGDPLAVRKCKCAHMVSLFEIMGQTIFNAPSPVASPLKGHVEEDVAFVGRMAASAPHLKVGIANWYARGKIVRMVTDNLKEPAP